MVPSGLVESYRTIVSAGLKTFCEKPVAKHVNVNNAHNKIVLILLVV